MRLTLGKRCVEFIPQGSLVCETRIEMPTWLFTCRVGLRLNPVQP